jgi:cold shock protein
MPAVEFRLQFSLSRPFVVMALREPYHWEFSMPEGTIKKVLADKGFGFIKADGNDLFFHHSELQGVKIEELREGDAVEFEVGQGKKGPCAISIRVV